MTSILILNGPNLNMLGQREPDIYGHETLADISLACEEKAAKLGLDIEFHQSNDEGALVTLVQEARKKHQGIIINAGGYTHSSVAIHDALKIAALPIIEVHISNIYKREDFRHKSLISLLAEGVICGLGPAGYTLALEAMSGILNNKKKKG